MKYLSVKNSKVVNILYSRESANSTLFWSIASLKLFFFL